MKFTKVILFLILILVSLGPVLANNESVDLYLFYGQGCPHCAKEEIFLENIVEEYPNLNIVKKEVYFVQENRELFTEISNSYGQEVSGVPTTFISGKVFTGFNPSIQEEITQEIVNCLEEKCISPLEYEVIDKVDPNQKVTLLAVLSAAIVDAINPCAFAVLIILLTTILATKKRKRALGAGLAFTISIYSSYLLMGVGLYTAIGVTGITSWFYTIVAILAIVIGIFNLKDYFYYGKWFITEVPIAWRPKLKKILQGVTSIPGAFFIGFIVSLFLLPCTSGPYIVILGLLSKVATKNYALLLLLLYNFVFVLPMVMITLGVYYGFTTTKKVELWRKSNLNNLHLIAGIILILLGVGMLMAVKMRLI